MKLSLFQKLIFAAASVLVFLALAEILMQTAGFVARNISRPELRPGAKIIVCLGDSHTYGVNVEAGESYPAQLERRLTARGGNYQVVNLGAPGQNSTQVLQSLPGILKAYRPAAVVVLVGMNNIWNIAGQETGAGRKVLDRIRLYRLFRILYYRRVAKGEDFLASERRDSGERLLHSSRGTKPKQGAEIEAIHKRLAKDLIQIVDLCKANHVNIVLMNYVGAGWENYFDPNAVAKSVATLEAIPLVDNENYFDGRFERRADGSITPAQLNAIFFRDMHLKPEGYKWLAENLYQTMVTQKLVE